MKATNHPRHPPIYICMNLRNVLDATSGEENAGVPSEKSLKSRDAPSAK